MSLKIWKGSLIFLAGIMIGISIEYLLSVNNKSAALFGQSLLPIQSQGASAYSFIHPLLGYRLPEATLFGDYLSLKDSLQDIIDAAVSRGDVTRVSVYFRDLDGGRWVGINPDDTFHPASLLKVPLMIAFYKEGETRPEIFNQRIDYDSSVMPDDPYAASSVLITGKSYSISELIRSMIVDSDNGATFTLAGAINPDFVNTVYSALGINNPSDEYDINNYQISARTFGLFFRILYNATYLSSASSDRALELLSKSSFNDGIVAGIPKGTLIANKFGDHVLSQNGTVTGVELSDCGIVYYPEHPYLLCVMTGGYNVPASSKIIASISRAAYAAVDDRYKIIKD